MQVEGGEPETNKGARTENEGRGSKTRVRQDGQFWKKEKKKIFPTKPLFGKNWKNWSVKTGWRGYEK